MNANVNPDAGLAEDSYPIDGTLSWTAVYYPIIKGYNGELISKSGTISFNSTDAKKGFEDIKALSDKKYSPSPLDTVSDLFLSSKSAMWFAVRPRLSNASDAGVNFDFAPFPALPVPSTGSGCSGYAISAKSTLKDKSWGFVKYIVSKEGQELFGSTGNGVPVLKSLAESGSWTKYKSDKLNHKAFTMYPERDINMSFAEAIAPEKHKAVYSEIQNMLIGLFNNYNDMGSLDKLVSTTEKNIKDILK
jgi:ABC-type glycerol-3-phosphate transport system substrate-binding protein